MTEISIDNLRNLITHFAKNTYRTKDADVTVALIYFTLILNSVKLTDHISFYRVRKSCRGVCCLRLLIMNILQ